MPCFSIKICLVSNVGINFFFLLVHPLYFEPKAGLYIAAWKFCTDPEWICVSLNLLVMIFSKRFKVAADVKGSVCLNNLVKQSVVWTHLKAKVFLGAAPPRVSRFQTLFTSNKYLVWSTLTPLTRNIIFILAPGQTKPDCLHYLLEHVCIFWC